MIPILLQARQIPEEHLGRRIAHGEHGASAVLRRTREQPEAHEHDVGVRDAELQQARVGWAGGREGSARVPRLVVRGGRTEGERGRVGRGKAGDGPENYAGFTVGFREDEIVMESYAEGFSEALG